MRNVTILLSAVLAMLIVAPAVAASAASAPATGKLESVQSNDFSNAVVMTGWALDPAVRNHPTSVLLTIDGAASGGWRSAAVNRPDVNAAQSATGGHGFVISLNVPTGKHTLCVAARPYTGAGSTALGCVSFQAYPQATKAQMLNIASSIDPKKTVAWNWTTLPSGVSGQAQPWKNSIDIASGNSTRYLRAVMLHEWSHVLQYRAFGGSDPWGDAVQAFNALLGDPGDRTNYNGAEHGADCIAHALGADYQGYGCSPALKAFGARIAGGATMKNPDGHLDSAKVSGSNVVVTGWTIDPVRPTSASSYRVTDNGAAVTNWLTTSTSRSDVNSALGVTGSHGFVLTVALAAGSHRICVSPAATGSTASPAALNGCTTVTR